jgi:hypothetical protein
MAEPVAPIEDVPISNLVDALRSVISKGLPVSDDLAGEVLPNLRSVYARAVVPSDRRSRVSALNQLLPRLIAVMDDATYRESEQTLFGLSPGTRDASLTDRRRQAATLRGYSYDHFRDQIEQQMLEAVATAIYDDLLRYRSRIRRTVESLNTTGDSPRLGPEHLSQEEELISRIWQHVYGLRAELIAFARLNEEVETREMAEDHRQLALRMEHALKSLLTEFAETYGKRLIEHGDAEFSLESLERLAGWNL